MKKNNSQRGFTLMELLVVVLIIGILIAIVVPQYQKAVLKTRLSHVIPIVKAIADAERFHYLTSDSYEIRDLSKLEIAQLPCSLEKINGFFICFGFIIDMGNGGFVDDNTLFGFVLDNGKAGRIAYAENVKTQQRYCIASKQSSLAQRVCQELGGKNPIQKNYKNNNRIQIPALVYTL